MNCIHVIWSDINNDGICVFNSLYLHSFAASLYSRLVVSVTSGVCISSNCILFTRDSQETMGLCTGHDMKHKSCFRDILNIIMTLLMGLLLKQCDTLNCLSPWCVWLLFKCIRVVPLLLRSSKWHTLTNYTPAITFNNHRCHQISQECDLKAAFGNFILLGGKTNSLELDKLLWPKC